MILLRRCLFVRVLTSESRRKRERRFFPQLYSLLVVENVLSTGWRQEGIPPTKVLYCTLSTLLPSPPFFLLSEKPEKDMVGWY